MDRALAARHGVPYVHAVAFAIDVDRVRDAAEHLDDPRPVGWEVFLTACYLEARCDPSDPTSRAMLEDAVVSVLELPPSDEDVLGSQLPFAVWALAWRGIWPAEIDAWFRAWRKKPRALAAALEPLFLDRARVEPALAQFVVSMPIEPPLSPPTVDALAAMARSGDVA